MPSLFPNYFASFWSLFRTPEKTFKAEIRYVPPCDGCVKCAKNVEAEVKPDSVILPKKDPSGPSILSRIFSIFQPVHAQDADVLEPEEIKEIQPLKEDNGCEKWSEICLDTSEFNVRPLGNGKMRIEINRKLGKTDFMIEGLKRHRKEEPNYSHKIECQELEIIPHDGHEYLDIDSEEFEVKRIRIKCLKEKVQFFSP